jgi:hypothetical protein
MMQPLDLQPPALGSRPHTLPPLASVVVDDDDDVVVVDDDDVVVVVVVVVVNIAVANLGLGVTYMRMPTAGWVLFWIMIATLATALVCSSSSCHCC